MTPTPELSARQDRQRDLLETQSARLELLILEHERAIEKYLERIDKLGDYDDPQAILVRCQVEYLILTARGQVYQFQQQLDSAREMIESMKHPILQPNYNYGMPMPMPTVPMSLKCDQCAQDFKIDGLTAFSTSRDELNGFAVERGWIVNVAGAVCPACQKENAA